MNIKELEKEAEEYAKKDCPDNFLCTRSIARRGYLAGAKSREKQIKALKYFYSRQIVKLEMQVLKLQAQIENKMKD